METNEGFDVHTGAMREHAGRLRGAAARFAGAADTAGAAPAVGEAFGLIGTGLAGDLIAMAGLAADALDAHAATVRATGAGVEAMADAYDAVEHAVRGRFVR